MSNVVVYSAPWCSGCKVVKKALEQDEVQFTEIDITTKDGGQQASALNIKSIPVTLVGDLPQLKFVGSKPETIKAILEAISD